MLKMSQQKRAAINNLGEAGSPFKHSRTQRIFKDAANLQIRGGTYDATHLEKFMDSDYGEKSLTMSNYMEQSRIRKTGNETVDINSQLSMQ